MRSNEANDGRCSQPSNNIRHGPSLNRLCGRDSGTMMSRQSPNLFKTQKPQSILKSQDNEFDPSGAEGPKVRNPYRRLRDPAELIKSMPKPSVPKVDAKFERTKSNYPTMNGASTSSAKPHLQLGYESDKQYDDISDRLVRSCRSQSAPPVNNTLHKPGGIGGDTLNIHPHLQSMTLYLDDHEHQGQSRKITISYTTTNFNNSTLMASDIMRFSKQKERFLQRSVKVSEDRLSAQRKKRSERLRQQQDAEKTIQKVEDDVTSRRKLLEKEAKGKQKTDTSLDPTLLTVQEIEGFRKRRIKTRSSLMPKTVLQRHVRFHSPIMEEVDDV